MSAPPQNPKKLESTMNVVALAIATLYIAVAFSVPPSNRKWAALTLPDKPERSETTRVSAWFRRKVHLRECKKELLWARLFAADGHRVMMEACLCDAKYHAEMAGALDSNFVFETKEIVESLASEVCFHLTESIQDFSCALDFTLECNPGMARYCLCTAVSHAAKACTLSLTTLLPMPWILTTRVSQRPTAVWRRARMRPARQVQKNEIE